MSMKEKIMPPLVLTLICVITSALLVAAYNITYVDTTGVITNWLRDLRRYTAVQTALIC